MAERDVAPSIATTDQRTSNSICGRSPRLNMPGAKAYVGFEKHSQAAPRKSPAMANPKLSLKLLVDRKNNRVVLAESQRDFVDLLFSFLTLPLGTIISVSNKQSMLGCMDKLYESVEKLDLRFMESEACKTMLLRPRNAAEEACENLKLDFLDNGRRDIYTCPTWECKTKTGLLFSHVKGATCVCGLAMDKQSVWATNGPKTAGVFVKGEQSFTISDDLHVVVPSTTDATLSILQRLGVKTSTALQEMTVEVGKEEMLTLLKTSVISATPLTDVFLRKVDVERGAAKLEQNRIPFATKCETPSTNTKNLKMKLVLSKTGNILLYAEAGGDVVDFLFSFLTFPLGSIVKLLDKCSCMGCVDNLYRSVEEIIHTDRSVHSEACATMLLCPGLFPHFACASQLLSIPEKGFRTCPFKGCKDCYTSGVTKCKHGIANVVLRAVNPKLPRPGTESGGGFTKGDGVFMITDDLQVAPYSPIASICHLSKLGISNDDLVVREVSLCESEALNLLKASLVSNAALGNVFCHRKRGRPALD